MGSAERGAERVQRFTGVLTRAARPDELLAVIVMVPLAGEDFETSVMVAAGGDFAASWFGPDQVVWALRQAADDIAEDHEPEPHDHKRCIENQQGEGVVDALGAVMDWLERNTPALPRYEAPPAGDPIADLLAKERARVCDEIWNLMGRAVGGR